MSSVMIRLSLRGGLNLPPSRVCFAHVFAGRPLPGPGDLQHTKRFCLLECYRATSIQFEQRQEASDDLDRCPAVGDQLGERRPFAGAARFQQRQQCSGLFGYRNDHVAAGARARLSVRPRRESNGGDLREPVGVDAEHHLRQQSGEAIFQRHGPRIAAQRSSLQLGEHLRHVSERPVLQQPGKQQVAHFQQRQIGVVLHLPSRQQSRGFEVQQRRGNHQERRGLLEFRARIRSCGCKR